MKPWIVLAETRVSPRATLVLLAHDGERVLRVNGRELMSSRRTASEERLGTLGGLVAVGRPSARLLVGGLGLGFTLRAALAAAPADASVDVAELLPDVVDWNRNPEFGLAADALADPRTRVLIGDVWDLLATGPVAGVRYDAIMLDADNETTAMMTAGNRRLMGRPGPLLLRDRLAPAGQVIFWCVEPNPPLEAALRGAGFTVSAESVRAWGHGGNRHWLVTGSLPAKRA